MIIIKPPHPVSGAVNLSKGTEVFSLAVNASVDKIISLEPSEEPIIEDTVLKLKYTHDPEYVSEIMDGTLHNGYGTSGTKAFSENIHSVHSCAILREAALIAIKNHLEPVFAPVSGFHHAGYNFGGGYCTFNGLIFAANAVRSIKKDANILIIDGDGHWGDGTLDFITKYNQGGIFNVALDKASVSGDFYAAMLKTRHYLCMKKWDLVIYQAGADSHIEDPYYSGYLSDTDWKYRDSAIFTYCRENKIPLVFNLAGGYNGSKTVMLHTDTVSTARSVYEERPRAHLSPLRDHG